MKTIKEQIAKKIVVMYQWLCKDGDDYWIHYHVYQKPGHAIRRLDETRMEVEVDE